MSTVVIGIGNRDRGDDGAGLMVTALLRAAGPPAGVEVVDGDGDPGRLLDAWDGMTLAIVVDAVHSHSAPVGHVHRLEVTGSELPTGAPNSHGLGPGDAVALASALDRLPERLLVYGIEGDRFALGDGMTRAVAEAAARVAAEITAITTEEPRCA